MSIDTPERERDRETGRERKREKVWEREREREREGVLMVSYTKDSLKKYPI